jgi:hypothetical protein
MQLLIPPDITDQLVDALSFAGQREIGGILMGEHVGPNTFRVKEITIQRKGGTFAAFVRIVSDLLTPLRAFFESTRHEYTKFNYLGEWHSHHSFALRPSGRDHSTMYDMVMDPELGARFLVLLLVKLNDTDGLEGGVTVYQPNEKPFTGQVVQEAKTASVKE